MLFPHVAPPTRIGTRAPETCLSCASPMPYGSLLPFLFILPALTGQEPRPFPTGRPASHRLQGGEVHTYSLTLQAGEYVKVAAEQLGVDLVLKVADPTAKGMAEVDSPNGALGPETCAFTAPVTGRYRITLQSLEASARPGRYRLSLPIRLSADAFRAHTLAPADPAQIDAVAGTYELEPGHRVHLSHNDYAGSGGHLALLDLHTRELKTLRPTTQGDYVTGPLPGVEFPVVETFRFERGVDGRGVAMICQSAKGLARKARRISPHFQEEVSFRNGDVTLQGKLLCPDGPGPHPAVVLVHGSGPATRHMGFYDTFFVHLGFAVLSFDKRGAGRSTGDWRHASMEELAGDVLAGVAYLRNRSDIDGTRVGLHGGSQEGWVGALAAAKDPHLAFLLVTCGSGVTVAENVVHENEGRLRQAGFRGGDLAEALAFAREMGLRATEGAPWEDLDRRFQGIKSKAWSEFVFPGGLPKDSPWWAWYRLNGAVDATKALASVRCPVGWFLADRDWNVPTARSARHLQDALQGRSGLIRTFPGASHMMMAARTGHDDERASVRHFTPGYWPAMTTFLAPWTPGSASGRPSGSGPTSVRRTIEPPRRNP